MLHLAFYIDSIPIYFLYFDLYLNTAYTQYWDTNSNLYILLWLYARLCGRVNVVYCYYCTTFLLGNKILFMLIYVYFTHIKKTYQIIILLLVVGYDLEVKTLWKQTLFSDYYTILILSTDSWKPPKIKNTV